MQTPQVLVADLYAETGAGQHIVVETPQAASLAEPVTTRLDICNSLLIYNI
jgi:hypothetical protein